MCVSVDVHIIHVLMGWHASDAPTHPTLTNLACAPSCSPTTTRQKLKKKNKTTQVLQGPPSHWPVQTVHLHHRTQRCVFTSMACARHGRGARRLVFCARLILASIETCEGSIPPLPPNLVTISLCISRLPATSGHTQTRQNRRPEAGTKKREERRCTGTAQYWRQHFKITF